MYHISQDKRAKQSSELLFNALERLMQSKSLRDISITDLVQEAQVGRTTFYRCFDTIEDVLRYKCDQEFSACAAYLKKSVFASFQAQRKAPFLLPFMQYWYLNFSIIELLVNAKREDLIKDSFVKMIEGLRSEFPHVEIKHYNYFVEIRAAIAIALLAEWVRTNRTMSPDALVLAFEKQLLMDHDIFDLVK